MEEPEMTNSREVLLELMKLRERADEIKTLLQFSDALAGMNMRPDLREEILRTCQSEFRAAGEPREVLGPVVRKTLDDVIGDMKQIIGDWE